MRFALTRATRVVDGFNFIGTQGAIKDLHLVDLPVPEERVSPTSPKKVITGPG